MEYILKIFSENPIWQTLWIVWFVLLMIAFSHKKDKHFYFWLMIWQFTYWVHFFIMWLYSGSFINFVNFIRTYVALKYKHIKILFYVFIFIYILIWFFTYTNIYSILPIISWILGVVAFLYFSWLKWRLLMLVIGVCWLVYAFMWKSIWWVMTELTIFTINLITIFRILKDKNEK